MCLLVYSKYFAINNRKDILIKKDVITKHCICERIINVCKIVEAGKLYSQ